MTRRYPGVESLGNGKYRIRTEVRHPKTGRVHEIDRRKKATDAAEASRLLASARAAWISKHSRVDAPGRRRLGEALDAWFKSKRAEVKASTAATYELAVKWWSKVLGDYYLDAIEPRDVREALAGSTVSGETKSGRLRVLRTAANEGGFANIVAGVKLRRDVRDDERMEDEGRGLTLDELRRFLEHGPTAWKRKSGETQPSWPRAWTLLYVMAMTGMRFGEATALEWKDIEADRIRIRRAVWHGIVDHPKAVASKRDMVLTDDVRDALREHRRIMLTEQLRGVDSPLVFPPRRESRLGYVTNGYARKSILRVCEVAGIKISGRPVVHTLRHTVNNLLRQSTSELVRQALVGHADASQNARYSNVGMDEKRAAMGAVLRMVHGK